MVVTRSPEPGVDHLVRHPHGGSRVSTGPALRGCRGRRAVWTQGTSRPPRCWRPLPAVLAHTGDHSSHRMAIYILLRSVVCLYSIMFCLLSSNLVSSILFWIRHGLIGVRAWICYVVCVLVTPDTKSICGRRPQELVTQCSQPESPTDDR